MEVQNRLPSRAAPTILLTAGGAQLVFVSVSTHLVACERKLTRPLRRCICAQVKADRGAATSRDPLPQYRRDVSFSHLTI